jgi:hypothetical protein
VEHKDPEVRCDGGIFIVPDRIHTKIAMCPVGEIVLYHPVYRTIRAMLLAGYCVIAMIGCSLTVPPKPDGPTKPDQPVVELEHPPAADVFNALGQYVENRLISSSVDLAKHVKLAADNGDLSVADVSRFTTEFGDATTKDRDLTSDDVRKLKSLK